VLPVRPPGTEATHSHTDWTGYPRREVLAAVGLSATVSTAGCLDSVLGRELRLAEFGVSNYGADAHRFDLRVRRDGEVVHRSSHEIRGRDEDRVYGAAPDCNWEGTPGAYEVSVRVDGGEWQSRSVAEARDGWRDAVSCASAHVWYEDAVRIDLRDDCADLFSVPPETCLPGDKSDAS
jgi:hypothetical protein